MPPLNIHVDVPSSIRVFKVCLSLHLHPFIVEGSSKGQARLHGCAGLSEPSLLTYVINTKISFTGT